MMLQLTDRKPLVYNHPLNHLITSMAYIDEESNVVPKSVINYMIKTQTTEINKPLKEYIEDLKLPETPFLNSPKFDELVILAQKRQKTKRALEAPVLPSNPEDVRSVVDRAQRDMEYNHLRTPNLQIAVKIGPLVMREHIDYLDSLKQHLLRKLQDERDQIENLNALRKYEQLQGKQRLDTIADRVKMMLSSQRIH